MKLPDDLHLGAFGSDAPWSINKKISWLKSVEVIRKNQQRTIPDLIKKPKLPPVGRGLKVLYVFGKAFTSWKIFHSKKHNSKSVLSKKIRESAEKLGPTYIKLAQIISAGDGIFPVELVQECKKCRDRVPAESFDQIILTIESELGSSYKNYFESISTEPIAAASIAQVHSAKLITGEEVVIKIQRTEISSLVFKDIKVMSWIAPLLIGRIKIAALANPPALVEVFAETISEELDFRVEASNMLDISKMLLELDRKEFIVPRPHPELVYKKILVMEKMTGFKFDDIKSIKKANLYPKDIIFAQMLGFLEGAFLHGLFHGDLHGGNLLITEQGQTALLDFGITGRLNERERIAFLKMLMSATTNNIVGQVEALRDLGTLPPDTDVEAVIEDLGIETLPADPTALEPEELVKELQQIIKALLSYGAKLPKPLMLYVKNLIFIDGAIATLAPELDMFQIVTDVATHFATSHGEVITKQLGITEEEWQIDLDSLKSGFGVDPTEVETLTYADLQKRRQLIRKRLGKSVIE